MIHYAGQSLLVPDADGRVEAFLGQHLAPRVDSIFLRPSLGRSDGLPVPRETWPEEPPFRLNTLYWPATGATRWAYGVFLADYDAKVAITQALSAGDDRVSEFGDALLHLSEGDYVSSLFSADDDGGFRLDEDGRVLLGTRMHLLPPRPVSMVDGKDLETLWLMPLVDRRYYWRDKPVPDDFEPTQWNEAIEAIADALDVTIDFDDVASELGSIEFTGLVRPHANAAELLDWVAAMLGRRVVCGPDGTVRLDTVKASNDRLEENLHGNVGEQWTRLAGGTFEHEANGAVFPATVRVVFADEGGAAVETSEIDFSDVIPDGPDYDPESPALPTGPPRTGETAVLTVPDGMLDDPDQTDYDDAARILARSLWGWRAARYDLTFAAIRRWQPTGFDDWIEWTVAGRFGVELCGQSRVTTLPVGWGMRGLAIVHHAAHGFGKLDQSVTEGRLTAGETVSVWKGPAFDPDEDTDRDLEAHYATDDMDADTYVTWSRVGGKVYVTPWECPE